jgi:5'-AMP-activated protein kinase catalytic alpha subunit
MNNEQNKQISKNRTIGKFLIGKAIGKGTFASVREGIHTPTNQKVAIKILHKKMIVDNRDKINLSREIRIFKKLRHPNIAQLFQMIENNSKIYFIMENV